MMRALFWIALLVLVVMAIRSKLRAAATRAASQSRDAGARRTPGRPPEIAAEPMSQCDFCGVYFPASETVRAEGHDYCSPAHARHTSH